MKYISFATQMGELLGQIRLCQELLKQEPTPEEDLLAMTYEELEAMLAQLRGQFLPNREGYLSGRTQRETEG